MSSLNPMLSATSDAAKAYLPQITIKGQLRGSKPKDGNAAYIWRMVGFTVSRDSRMHCMPMTADFGVVVPQDWQVEAPKEFLDAELAKPKMDGDHAFIRDHSPDGTELGFHRQRWQQHARRKTFIKQVLDPIVEEIIASVPKTQWHGTMRWGRALGAF